MSEKSAENCQNDHISVRKLGHYDLIWTKLKLDLGHTLVDHNPKYQRDISKHVRKKSGKLIGQTDRQTDRQNGA